MGEDDAGGVEPVAGGGRSETRDWRLETGDWRESRGTIEGVAGDGVAGGGEMAADLVGDAGEDDDVEEREFFSGLKGRPGRDGVEAVACLHLVEVAHDGHLAGAARLMGEGGVEATGGVDDAVDEGGVVFFDGEAAELRAEGGVGGGRFRGEDEAGGLRVEAMQQRGKEAIVADVGERGEARDEGVGEGVGLGGAQRMRGLSGGLVEGEDAIVFVQDVQRQVGVGPEAEIVGFGDVAAVEDVAGGEFGALGDAGAVAGDGAGGDEFLDGGAVEPGVGAEQVPVEAGAGAGNGVLFAGDHGRKSPQRPQRAQRGECSLR